MCVNKKERRAEEKKLEFKRTETAEKWRKKVPFTNDYWFRQRQIKNVSSYKVIYSVCARGILFFVLNKKSLIRHNAHNFVGFFVGADAGGAKVVDIATLFIYEPSFFSLYTPNAISIFFFSLSL